MLGNMGNLFMKSSHKRYLYHLLRVLDYYVMSRQTVRAVWEKSDKVTIWLTDPYGWLCEIL